MVDRICTEEIYNNLILKDMFGKRVKFMLRGSDEIQIGRFVKDKMYKNRYKVKSEDKKSAYCISLLSMLESF